MSLALRWLLLPCRGMLPAHVRRGPVLLAAQARFSGALDDCAQRRRWARPRRRVRRRRCGGFPATLVSTGWASPSSPRSVASATGGCLRVVSPLACQCLRRGPHATIGPVTQPTPICCPASPRTRRDRASARAWLEAGPPRVPVILVHGNLSTSRFLEHVPAAAPPRFRFVLPDMRAWPHRAAVDRREPAVCGTGRTTSTAWSRPGYRRARAPLAGPPAAPDLALRARAWPGGVADLRRPGAPYGSAVYTATAPCATPTPPAPARGRLRGSSPAYAWVTGGPTPLLPTQRHEQLVPGAVAPRRPAREDLLVHDMLRTLVGDDGSPAHDALEQLAWRRAGHPRILNALSPKNCNWSQIVDLDPQAADPVDARRRRRPRRDARCGRRAPWVRPAPAGWPGIDVFPPKPMGTHCATSSAGRCSGRLVRTEIFAGSGHGPMFESTERWTVTFFGFVESVA